MANISKIRLSGVTYTIVDESAVHDLSNYYTTAQTNSQITAATSALAQTIEEAGYQNASQVNAAITAVTNPINSTLTAHTANTEIHVTVNDKAAWNAKLDAADVEGLFGYSEYDTETHRINFKNTSTGSVLSYIDASPFIVDGMVQNVEIKDVTIEGESVTCLVVSFNTDAGKQDINIPISQIFDPTNYVNVTTYNSYTAATDARLTEDEEVTAAGLNALNDSLASKQDQLVSGTNIKTINNTSILGSGNIEIQAGGTVDTQMSDVSENAVQNKVIKAYADTKNQLITLSGETLIIS